LEFNVRNDLLDSGDEGEERIDLRDANHPKAQKILDYYHSWKINGRVLRISNKLYQIKIPKMKLDLDSTNFDLLEVLDFSKPFLKPFSTAKLEVLKKSFTKSINQTKPKKFPSNFVPLTNSKDPVITQKKPKIDFKPFFPSKNTSFKPKNNSPPKLNENEKSNKMKELLKIVKKHVEPNIQKEEQIKEKNKLDAMFNDIFAGD
jgi:hypothetical protein